MKEFFEVAVGQSTNMKGRPAPDIVCGHKHRTLEAAYKCQEKLKGWSKDRKTCSSKWYSSFVLCSDGTKS